MLYTTTSLFDMNLVDIDDPIMAAASENSENEEALSTELDAVLVGGVVAAIVALLVIVIVVVVLLRKKKGTHKKLRQVQHYSPPDADVKSTDAKLDSVQNLRSTGPPTISKQKKTGGDNTQMPTAGSNSSKVVPNNLSRKDTIPLVSNFFPTYRTKEDQSRQHLSPIKEFVQEQDMHSTEAMESSPALSSKARHRRSASCVHLFHEGSLQRLQIDALKSSHGKHPNKISSILPAPSRKPSTSPALSRNARHRRSASCSHSPLDGNLQRLQIDALKSSHGKHPKKMSSIVPALSRKPSASHIDMYHEGDAQRLEISIQKSANYKRHREGVIITGSDNAKL
jgi:hypothetical protein